VFNIFFGKWIEEAIFDLIGHKFGLIGDLTKVFKACFFNHWGIGNNMSAPVKRIQQFEFNSCGLEGDERINMGVSYQGKNFIGGEIRFDLDMSVFGNCFLQHL